VDANGQPRVTFNATQATKFTTFRFPGKANRFMFYSKDPVRLLTHHDYIDQCAKHLTTVKVDDNWKGSVKRRDDDDDDSDDRRLSSTNYWGFEGWLSGIHDRVVYDNKSVKHSTLSSELVDTLDSVFEIFGHAFEIEVLPAPPTTFFRIKGNVVGDTSRLRCHNAQSE